MSQQSLEDIKEFISLNYQQKPKNINMSADYQHPIGPQGAKVLMQEINWDIEMINVNMYGLKDEGMQAII